MQNLIFGTVVATCFVIAACSSSSKTSGVATDNNQITGKSFSKIFIEVATVDVEVRNELESAIVAAVISEGYLAVKSLDVIPFSLKELKLPAKDEIELKVKENGCDAILIVSLSRKGETINYSPGVSRKANSQFLAGVLGDVLKKNHNNAYVTPTAALDVPGSYSHTNANFILQGNLYDAVSQEIVFADESAGVDINAINKISKAYAAGLVTEIKKEKFLTRPGNK